MFWLWDDLIEGFPGHSEDDRSFFVTENPSI